MFSARYGSLNHAFHLHGYSFAVLAVGVFKNGSNLDTVLLEFRARNLSQSHVPPLVDTLGVPSQGYAIVRFKADNPGKETYNPETA
jgi:laccase